MSFTKTTRSSFIYLFLAMLAILDTGIFADNAAMGLRGFKVPGHDGDKVISATIQLPAGKQLDQRRISSRPGNGKLRLVLEYSTPGENFSVIHRIVPRAKRTGTDKYKVKAVLSQSSMNLNPHLPASIYPSNPIYYRAPINFKHGDKVLYRWRLETPQGSGTQTGDIQSFDMPHPIVIALMGDSYGSGEGAPMRTSTFVSQVEWTNKSSHRSNRGGHFKGVGRFQRKNAELWIVQKYVAVSGATIVPGPVDSAGRRIKGDRNSPSGGIVNGYLGDRDLKVFTGLVPISVPPLVIPIPIPIPVPVVWDVRIPGQIAQVEQWLQRNGYSRTHVLIFSAGGNDAGFSGAIVSAVMGNMAINFPGVLAGFQENLEIMDRAIVEQFMPALDELIKPQQIIWTDYMDMTVDDNMQISGINADASLNAGLAIMNLTVGADDLRNAAILLKGYLNPAIEASCARFNESSQRCHFLSVESRARGHGINADKAHRWFNTFVDAQDRVEGSVDGAMHPNAEGYNVYTDVVSNKLQALYGPQAPAMVVLRREYKDAKKAADKARAKEKAIGKMRNKAFEKRFDSTKRAVEVSAQLDTPVLQAMRKTHSLITRQQVADARTKRIQRLMNRKSRYSFQNLRVVQSKGKNAKLQLPSAKKIKQLEALVLKKYGAKKAARFKSDIREILKGRSVDRSVLEQAALSSARARVR